MLFVNKYFDEFLKHVEEVKPSALAEISETRLLSEENKTWLSETAEAFTKSFLEKI